ncbi:hypothetical protein VP01_3242g1 [Puccinia sorghi]|uniref:Uncharacterized protein n=1 Tax=Puccinia sorghi TaxID=27349 RepID=A0A0L6UY15_9BASI|nr:hypothetical protein VP01_3242g1 [Puccinia sorghi]
MIRYFFEDINKARFGGAECLFENVIRCLKDARIFLFLMGQWKWTERLARFLRKTAEIPGVRQIQLSRGKIIFLGAASALSEVGVDGSRIRRPRFHVHITQICLYTTCHVIDFYFICVLQVVTWWRILTKSRACHVETQVGRKKLHMIKNLHCRSGGDSMAVKQLRCKKHVLSEIIVNMHVVPTSNNPSLACLTSKNSSQLPIKEALLSSVSLTPSAIKSFTNLIISSSQQINHSLLKSVVGGTSIKRHLKVQFVDHIKYTGRVITPRFEHHTELNHTSPSPLVISVLSKRHKLSLKPCLGVLFLIFWKGRGFLNSSLFKFRKKSKEWLDLIWIHKLAELSFTQANIFLRHCGLQYFNKSYTSRSSQRRLSVSFKPPQLESIKIQLFSPLQKVAAQSNPNWGITMEQENDEILLLTESNMSLSKDLCVSQRGLEHHQCGREGLLTIQVIYTTRGYYSPPTQSLAFLQLRSAMVGLKNQEDLAIPRISTTTSITGSKRLSDTWIYTYFRRQFLTLQDLEKTFSFVVIPKDQHTQEELKMVQNRYNHQEPYQILLSPWIRQISTNSTISQEK